MLYKVLLLDGITFEVLLLLDERGEPRRFVGAQLQLSARCTAVPHTAPDAPSHAAG